MKDLRRVARNLGAKNTLAEKRFDIGKKRCHTYTFVYMTTLIVEATKLVVTFTNYYIKLLSLLDFIWASKLFLSLYSQCWWKVISIPYFFWYPSSTSGGFCLHFPSNFIPL